MIHSMYVESCMKMTCVIHGHFQKEMQISIRTAFQLQSTGFSLQWLLLLQSTGSRHMVFSSCSMQAQKLQLACSLAPEHVASVVVAHRLSCSTAYGIFLNQGLKLCPLYWKADSDPLYYQGSPSSNFFALNCSSSYIISCYYFLN